MSNAYLLNHHLSSSANRFPERDAVVFGDTSLSYRDLDVLSNKLARALMASGVRRGDRVAIYVSKSLASVVSIFGILKTGAAYVPLDPSAPAQRLAYIIRDSGVGVLLTSGGKVHEVKAMFPEKDHPLRTVILVDCDQSRERLGSQTAAPVAPEGTKVIHWDEVVALAGESIPEETTIETDTAYILYTSGSTGTPKGVMLSHRNSLAFVDWACEFVGLTPDDRVSSHAPIHFDLSTFDIFASCRAGAAIVLVPEGTSAFPVNLSRLIEKQRISVWYSVPSVLTLMILYGNLGNYDLSCLRTIIFAGEVFPTKYLQRLMAALPKARYLNWYGPTETNVCTSYEVAHLDPERTAPIPIGKASSGDEVFAVDSQGKRITQPGEKGELYVRGPTVMQGYWGDRQKTGRVLVRNHFNENFDEFIYRTGDVVTLDGDGNLLYLGREDGMIKTRGYRVEIGEIEAVIYAHPAVREAAVLAIPDELVGNRLRAVISCLEAHPLTREEVLSFCSQRLPHYMVPEVIEFRDKLPRTSTGKTDRVELAKQLTAGA